MRFRAAADRPHCALAEAIKRISRARSEWCSILLGFIDDRLSQSPICHCRRSRSDSSASELAASAGASRKQRPVPASIRSRFTDLDRDALRGAFLSFLPTAFPLRLNRYPGARLIGESDIDRAHCWTRPVAAGIMNSRRISIWASARVISFSI